MEILEYFSLPDARRSYWEDCIGEGSWRAAPYLSHQLRTEAFQGRYGPNGRVFLLTDDDHLVSFCTLVRQDEILDDALLPWIGFVYTFPAYRGHRYSQQLIQYVCGIAKSEGHKYVYLSSDEDGLYEKYGFAFYHHMKTVDGHKTQVFFREL